MSSWTLEGLTKIYMDFEENAPYCCNANHYTTESQGKKSW